MIYPHDTGYPLGTASGGEYIPGGLATGAASANLLRGGNQQFLRLADRDAIPVDVDKGMELDGVTSGRRSHMMRVDVTETLTAYQLQIPGFDQLSDTAKVVALADNAHWLNVSIPKIDESNLVHRTSDETIAGNKIFNDSVALNVLKTAADGLTVFTYAPGTSQFTIGDFVNGRMTFKASDYEFYTREYARLALRLGNDGNVLVNNNLGVGVGNPSERVEVAGNVKAIKFIGDGSQMAGVVHLAGTETISGSKTFTSPTYFYGTGGDTAAGGEIASFTSPHGQAADATKFFTFTLNKSGVEAFVFGINKNSQTGQIPANAAFISSYSGGGSLAFGRGDNNGNPSTADLFIGSNGVVSIGDPTSVEQKARLNVAGDIYTPSRLILQLDGDNAFWGNMGSTGSGKIGLQTYSRGDFFTLNVRNNTVETGADVHAGRLYVGNIRVAYVDASNPNIKPNLVIGTDDCTTQQYVSNYFNWITPGTGRGMSLDNYGNLSTSGAITAGDYVQAARYFGNSTQLSEKLVIINNTTDERGLIIKQSSNDAASAAVTLEKSRNGGDAQPGDLIGFIHQRVHLNGQFTKDRGLFGGYVTANNGIGYAFMTGMSDNNYSPSFRVDENGNVSIGNYGSLIPYQIQSISEKLEVNGNVKAQMFIGDGSQMAGVVHLAGTETVTGDKVFSGRMEAAGDLFTKRIQAQVYEYGPIQLATFFAPPASSIYITIGSNQVAGPGYCANFGYDANGSFAFIAFNNRPNTDFTVGYNGNVGIGTAAVATEKLEVTGNVKAQKFIGDGSQLTGLPASGSTIKQFAEFTVTADGAQAITVNGISSAVNVQVLETSGYVRTIYLGYLSVSSNTLSITADANIKAGDKIMGVYC